MSTTTDWMQVGLLAVNAGLIASYLRETIKMRQAAERQVTVSQEELESHVKPALIARLPDKSPLVELVNIGSGPALHLEFVSVLRGSVRREIVTGIEGYDRIVFLEPQQTRTIHVRTRGQEIPGMNTFFLDSSGRSLRCEYKSLSGRVYFTVVDFDHTGNFVENTQFGECGPRTAST